MSGAPVPVDYDPFARQPLPQLPEPDQEEAFPPKSVPYTIGGEKKEIVLPDVKLPVMPGQPEETKKAKKLPVPVDYDPFANKPAAAPEAPMGASSPWVRGAVTGVAGSMQNAGSAADLFTVFSGGDKNSKMGQLAGMLTEAGKETGGGYERQEPSVFGVGSAGEAYTYGAETIANAVASTFPSLATGAAGAALASPGGPLAVGAGAFTGAAIPSFIDGAGGAWTDLQQDKGVAGALQSGKVTREQLANYAVATGALIGAFDAIGAGKIVKLTGIGKEAIAGATRQTLLAAVKKGIVEGTIAEGTTEALQQLVTEGAQALIGGDTNLLNRAMNVADSFLQGALGGGVMGGGAGAYDAATQPPPPAVVPPPPATGANPAQANTNPTGGPGDPAGQGAAGGAAPVGQPPQPVGDKAPPEDAAKELTTVVPVDTAPKPFVKPEDVPAPVGTPAPDTLTPAPQDTVEVVGNGQVAGDIALAVREATGGQPAVTETPTPALDKTEEQRAAERAERRRVLDEERAKVFPELPPPPEDAPAQDLRAPRIGPEGVIPEEPEPIEDDYEEPVVATEEDQAEASPIEQEEMAARVEAEQALRQTASGIGARQPNYLAGLLARVTPQTQTGIDQDVDTAVKANISPAQEPDVKVEPPVVPQLPAAPAEAGARQELPPPPLQAPAGLRLPEPAPIEGEIIPPNQVAPVQQQPFVQENRKALANTIADSLREAIASSQDLTFDSPDTPAVITGVATDIAYRMPAGVTPADIVKAVSGPGMAIARKRLAQIAESNAAQAAAAEEAKQDEAIAQAKQRRLAGKPEERGRSRKTLKPVDELEGEDDKSLIRAYEKNPEDEDLQEFMQAYKERDTVARAVGYRASKTAREVVTRPYNERMQAARKRRIDKAKAEAEAKPEKARGLSNKARQAAKREKEAEAVAKTIKEFPEFTTGSTKAVQTEGPKYIRALVAALNKAIGRPGKRVDVAQSGPEHSLVAWLTGISKGESAASIYDVWLALKEYKAGNVEGLKKAMALNPVRAKSIDKMTGTEQVEAAANKHGTGPKIEEAPPSFDAPPIPPTPENPALPGELRRLTGAQVLRQALIDAGRHGGLFQRLIQKMHAKRLLQMVGDVDVRLMTRQGMGDYAEAMGRQRTKAVGRYVSPQGKDRTEQGHRPFIMLDAEWVSDPDVSPERVLQVVMHEMTHAATDYALNHDLYGTRKIVRRMMNDMEAQLKARGLWNNLGEDMRYGFINEHEFVTEAYSSPEFQELMTQLQVPLNIRREIGFLPTEAPTWWDMFVRAVSNAIRLFDRSAPRGINYLEQVIRMHPNLMMAGSEQEQLYREQYFADEMLRQIRDEDGGPLTQDMVNLWEGMKERAKNASNYSISQANVWNKLASTDELGRRITDVLGHEDPDAKLIGELHVGIGELKKQFRERGDIISSALAHYINRNPVGAEALSESIHDSSIKDVDPRKTAAQQKISKKGIKDEARRVALAVETAKYNALDAEAKHLFDQHADHYTQFLNDQQDLTVKLIVDRIMANPGKTMPAGETVQTIRDWVVNGDIDRVVANQTQRDKDLHAALGKSAATLKNAKQLRKVRGVYVPLMRQGQYVFTARHKVATPAGALSQTENPFGVEIVFPDNDALVKAFVASQPDEIMPDIKVKWIDPLTGATTKKQNSYTTQAGVHVDPERRVVVTVQNRIVEMGDSWGKLESLRKQFAKQGMTTTNVVDKGALTDPAGGIMPGHVAAMNRSIDQLPQATAIKSAAKHASEMAYARSLVGTRAQQRRLPRLGVKGFSHDLLMSTHVMNGVLAGNLAHLTNAGKMIDARENLDKRVEAARRLQGGGNQAIKYQRLAKELLFRVDNTSTAVGEANAGVWGTTVRTVMDVSFMNHLMSPAYSLVNATQPATMLYPLQAGMFGDLKTAIAHTRSALRLGPKNWGRGLYETGRMTFNWGRFPKKPHDYYQGVRRDLANSPHGAAKVRALDKLKSLGYWASGGLELPETGEIGRSPAGKIADRAVQAARELPESVEVVNRALSIDSTVDLAMDAGMTEDQAVDLAVQLTVKSQGGYAAENNPVFMSDRKWKAPLQFKKYPLLYGQMYVRAIWETMALDTDPIKRKEAAKLVARMSAMTVAFAGLTGLPMFELAKMWAIVAASLGAGDDWEENENDMQVWFKQMFEHVMSEETSAEAAESLIRGGTRAFGLDLHGRMSNHLLTFGSPQRPTSESTRAWLFDMVAGAPGGMADQMLRAAAKDDIDWSKALPWPKFIGDILKAKDLYTEGTTGKQGQQYAPPIGIGEAIGQALGFRPASSARQYEPGGSGTITKQKAKTATERQAMMATWRSKSGAEKGEYFRSEIRKWNAEHRDPRERIDMGDLQRSIRSSKARDRERDREMRNAQ